MDEEFGVEAEPQEYRAVDPSDMSAEYEDKAMPLRKSKMGERALLSAITPAQHIAHALGKLRDKLLDAEHRYKNHESGLRAAALDIQVYQQQIDLMEKANAINVLTVQAAQANSAHTPAPRIDLE